MENETWRFPASGGGERKGISNGDIEAFRKSPMKSFAREILQNSIDARSSDEEPTKVSFKIFEINTKEIPGYDALKSQVNRCKEFWAYKKDYVEEYDSILNILEEDKIVCLRVSDFNTTGLVGVESDIQKNNKFLALAKGTGVSEKTGLLAGGSKGVGKNAAFLMSSINTVFYSTRTNQDVNGNGNIYEGAIGVSELVSGYVDDDVTSSKRDYTQGTGYFSRSDLNSSLQTLLELDPSFTRGKEFGTDIFILGFKNEDGWQNEIINSLLDSFMSTIVRGELEIDVDGLLISKDTVENIVYDDTIIFKTNKSNVISQFRLLKNANGEVHVYDVETEYGNCELYILPYSKKEDDLATHKCVMIRHPLMKIKEESLGANFRVSAMCIIGEGKLGQILRSIENPQHIDWEIRRIADKTIRKEVDNVLKSIRSQIRDAVIDCLKLDDDKQLDPNGAGDYLPDSDIGDSSNKETEGEQDPSETTTVSKQKKNKTTEKKGTIENDDGNALEPDIGLPDSDNDGDVSHPDGENEGRGGDNHPGSETSGKKDGDSVIYEKKKLSGIRYKVICIDKAHGELKIIFVAPLDYDNCYLALNLLDDANNSMQIKINSLSCNGIQISSNDSYEYGPFMIKQNEKIILNVSTDAKGYFGSEVKVICK